MDNVLQAIENLMARREKQITELDSSRTIILSQLHGAMKNHRKLRGERQDSRHISMCGINYQGYNLNGAGMYVDEFRISDICRYTENFTPPTQPFGNPMGLIQSTQPINLLDKTSITGITTTGIEPSNTSRRLVFGVDGTWNKLTTDSLGSASLTALSEQNITVDSVLLEGNTVAELDEVTSVPGFAGKLIYPAAALYASADASVMPTLGLTIEAADNPAPALRQDRNHCMQRFLELRLRQQAADNHCPRRRGYCHQL